MRSQQRKVGIAWFTTPSAVLSSKMNKLVAKKKDDLWDRPVGANLSNVKHGPTPVDLSFSRSTTALLTDQGSSAALRQPNPVHREGTSIVISQHSAISISHISSVVQTRSPLRSSNERASRHGRAIMSVLTVATFEVLSWQTLFEFKDNMCVAIVMQTETATK